MSDNQSKLNDEFISLLMKFQRRIYGYIKMLVPCKAQADDLMQETVLIMLRKFDQFKPDSDFVAWAIRIAHLNIFEYRRKQNKNNLVLTDQALKAVLYRYTETFNQIDNRIDALEGCISKLKVSDRQLIHMRYYLELKCASIAERLGRKVDGVYHSFSRIHRLLQQCIVEAISSQGGD